MPIKSTERQKYVNAALKAMREKALIDNFKRYARLPEAVRMLIAQEAGLDYKLLSKTTAAERRKLQAAAKVLAGRRSMAYVGQAVEILTRSCTE